MGKKYVANAFHNRSLIDNNKGGGGGGSTDVAVIQGQNKSAEELYKEITAIEDYKNKFIVLKKSAKTYILHRVEEQGGAPFISGAATTLYFIGQSTPSSTSINVGDNFIRHTDAWESEEGPVQEKWTMNLY